MTEAEFAQILKDNGMDICELAGILVKELADNKLKAATAESCTGGLVSKLITDVPGASAVFDCGVCSYANSIKSRLLGVSEDTLFSFGAVSPQTAQEMAKGVRLLADADIGVSTTGIAGPGGGTKEKPVGLIYIGISTADSTFSVRADLTANTDSRNKKRQLAAAMAIYCVIDTIRTQVR